MGRYHSEYMRILFPNQKANGIDMGNVEIKESNNNHNMFTVSQKDMIAEYFLFYNHISDMFYICDCEDFPYVKRKRGFRIHQIEKISFFRTKDIDKLMEKLREIIKDLSFLPNEYRSEQNE